jgi:transcription elongation factor GreA
LAADKNHSFTEALSKYITIQQSKNQQAKNQQDGQVELNRFIQWCGRDRDVNQLSPSAIEEYAESAGMWGADSASKLKAVKAFLTFLSQKKLTSIKLAPHLKASKPKKGSGRVYIKTAADQAQLSAEGYAKLLSRREMLKEEGVKIIADIGRAMADKDFRENAPLDAAKERQGQIASGIRDLDSILSNAIVSVNLSSTHDKQVRLGKKITLRDMESGKKLSYTVVDSRETDPVTGKISNISPVGKALLDKSIGEEVHITVPKGALRYIIEKIEN